MHAASVYPEPGSNSPFKTEFLRTLTFITRFSPHHSSIVKARSQATKKPKRSLVWEDAWDSGLTPFPPEIGALCAVRVTNIGEYTTGLQGCQGSHSTTSTPPLTPVRSGRDLDRTPYPLVTPAPWRRASHQHSRLYQSPEGTSRAKEDRFRRNLAGPGVGGGARLAVGSSLRRGAEASAADDCKPRLPRVGYWRAEHTSTRPLRTRTS